ncbi:BIIDXI-like protein At5g11420 [Bidens hawaiensis]|uniref:BIIDXI-like protein At5g11420 n=1 Tax=Bidens hawaiensis TaxID=980011 RepID=UPI00404B773D
MASTSLTIKWLPLLLLSLLITSHLVAITTTFAAEEDGLLANGNFETAPTGGFTDDGATDSPDGVPSWKLNGTVELVASGQKQGGMILIVPEGRHAVRLGNDAQISQQVKLEKGEIYSIIFSASRTCAQLESLNVSVPPASQTIDLQTLYSVQSWDTYAWAFQADQEDANVVFTNPGMEDDPTCGPIIDDIAIKKLFVPTKPKENAVLNGDFEEGPWMFRNASLGVLLPTNLDEETSSLPGWIVESNRAVRYIDSYHFSVPGGKRAVELLSGKEGIISQMVPTKPNKPYTMSFSLGHAGDSCKQPLAVMAFAGDQAENVHYTPNANSTFQTANVNFTAKAERTRVAFYSVYYNTRSDDMSSLCGPVVDDIRVVVSGGVRSVTMSGLGFGFMVLVMMFMV